MGERIGEAGSAWTDFRRGWREGTCREMKGQARMRLMCSVTRAKEVGAGNAEGQQAVAC